LFTLCHESHLTGPFFDHVESNGGGKPLGMVFCSIKISASDFPVELSMKKGISPESKELRRHLLSHNGPVVVERMKQSGLADPVGLIIEMTDDIGKQLTYAALEKQGMPRHQIPELIAS